MIPFINIPVPATVQTAGAQQDVSTLSALLAVAYPIPSSDDVIVLEQSFDAGAHWEPVATFSASPGFAILQVDGNLVRAFRQIGSGGAYNLQAAGQQLGNPGNFNLTIPAVGASAVQDISALPQNLNLFYDSPSPDDTAAIQVSLDGTNYVPLTPISGQRVYQVQCGANDLKVTRPGGGNAGTLRGNGVPAK